MPATNNSIYNLAYPSTNKLPLLPSLLFEPAQTGSTRFRQGLCTVYRTSPCGTVLAGASIKSQAALAASGTHPPARYLPLDVVCAPLEILLILWRSKYTEGQRQQTNNNDRANTPTTTAMPAIMCVIFFELEAQLYHSSLLLVWQVGKEIPPIKFVTQLPQTISVIGR
mmetsp:Transcript_51793/g.84570  ORF Transcript_51793/g.84570 Transcript_51793/m.84570 type:complete len:168 (-) Transcript_51793:125-628(-)